MGHLPLNGGRGLALPALTSMGVLPPGRHTGTLQDIKAQFVTGAPNQDRREMIFRALELYSELVWRLFPSAKLWVDGGFVTHKVDAPNDVDVVAVVDPTSDPVASVDDVNSLRTLINVEAHLAGSGWLIGQQRLQPMGGLVDGYFATATNQLELDFWDGWWSTVKDAPDGTLKGYVEVVP